MAGAQLKLPRRLLNFPSVRTGRNLNFSEEISLPPTATVLRLTFSVSPLKEESVRQGKTLQVG